ncbi:MarR family winged helix-turn-helix transcriptional regulator [Pararhodonellum marinum]|uniref:MarR family winged helix-turn-helix transcriptional regulator n=1 Tax=Pararhodonellum marinum TaxID=2755358 RepID=UPI0018900C8C|nr:MarR family transcriptional regulator [Pararhodonellum marinum]
MTEEKEKPALSNQMSFPLYAASRLMIQNYREPLLQFGLTYPQYLVMLVLWEEDGLTVSKIGERLYLDSGTLTPVLKRLEAMNLVKRKRDEHDERLVQVQLTYPGKSLQAKASKLPDQVMNSLEKLPEKDLKKLKLTLEKLIEVLK